MKKIKKFFYFLTIKTPITVVLIITVTFFSLIVISYYNYTNEYVKQQGTIKKDETGNNFIKAEFDKKYVRKINNGSKAIWYVSSSGKRYEGSVEKADSEESSKCIETNIIIDKNDMAKEFKNTGKLEDKQVTVEVCLKKVRILDKILKKDVQ